MVYKTNSRLFRNRSKSTIYSFLFMKKKLINTKKAVKVKSIYFTLRLKNFKLLLNQKMTI